MKAFLLCAGLGSRLRPYTHHIPKSAMPFLNLPLLCYNWFYLEKMGADCFYLNSHLFPKILERLTWKIKKESQFTKQTFEPDSLGSAGGLYSLKKDLESQSFFYLNGDSLFFPSRLELLSNFKKNLNSLLGQLYTVPFSKKEKVTGAIWIDSDYNIKFIGSTSPDPKLKPVKFAGLAHFSYEIFNYISSQSHHIFDDVMTPLLKTNKFKAFVDEKGLVFEGGSESGLLEATDLNLKYLFSFFPSSSKNILKKVFKRFDSKNEMVGFKYKQNKGRILYPNSSKNLSVKGFAVIGKDVLIESKSYLENSVLDGNLKWKGDLKNKILMKF